jgi:hypothetical protein
MTFQNLVFKPHPNGIRGCKQAKHKLPNGITISVVGGGTGLYGDGKDTFEMGAWFKKPKSNEWIPLSENDDVIGWQSKTQITELIQKLLKYPN